LLTGDWAFAAASAALGALPWLGWVHRVRKRVARVASWNAQDVAAVVEDLRRRQPAPGTTSLRFEIDVISSAKHLFLIRRYDACAEILQLLDWGRLETLALVEAATTLARCLLFSGHIASARTTFERARGELAQYGDRAAAVVLDATLLVHEGKPRKALELLADLEVGPGEGARGLRVDILLVRAHAAVALAEHEKSVELIGALRSEGGADAVALLALPEGPATALARELSSRSAYR
jgi:hypothetical protein